MSQPDHVTRGQYAWPKYVLAGVLLFFLLAAIWMSKEIVRVKRIKADTQAQKSWLVLPSSVSPTATSSNAGTNGPAPRGTNLAR